MAVTLPSMEQGTLAGDNNYGQITISYPAGTQVGDIVYIICRKPTYTQSAPSGFSQVFYQNVSGVNYYVWRKVSAGESSVISYRVGSSGTASSHAGQAIAFCLPGTHWDLGDVVETITMQTDAITQIETNEITSPGANFAQCNFGYFSTTPPAGTWTATNAPAGNDEADFYQSGNYWHADGTYVENISTASKLQSPVFASVAVTRLIVSVGMYAISVGTTRDVTAVDDWDFAPNFANDYAIAGYANPANRRDLIKDDIVEIEYLPLELVLNGVNPHKRERKHPTIPWDPDFITHIDNRPRWG